MPNWCDNNILITGPKHRLLEFDEAFKGFPAVWKDGTPTTKAPEKQYTFNAMVPVPENIKESFNDFGYNWCNEHWGTKWDPSHIYQNIVEVNAETVLVYDFFTAYVPPLAWLLEASKQFADLRFKLKAQEPSNEIYMDCLIQNGAIIQRNPNPDDSEEPEFTNQVDSVLSDIALDSSAEEIRIADLMDHVLCRQCRIDDIEVQVAKGVVHLYDAQDSTRLAGLAAYHYYLDCISGLEPTPESIQVDVYFAANPVQEPKSEA